MKKKKLNKLRIRADVVKENLQKELLNTDIVLHSTINVEGEPIVLCIYSNEAERQEIEFAMKRLESKANIIKGILLTPLLKGDPSIEVYLNAIWPKT